MANNSVVTQEVLQNTIERYHEDFVYPYLNGATHTGCVPLGTILPYFGETAPTHFLICDGTEYAKADYPELAEHLLALTDPTPYVGSDTNHFKVPDLRGEFLRGSGTNGHTNQGDGGNIGEHQDATLHPNVFTEGLNIGSFVINNSSFAVSQNSDKQISNGSGRIYAKCSYASGQSSNYIAARPTNTSVTYIIAYRNAYIDLALDSFPIDISNPTDGQLLMYDATAGRWVNGGHKYSTEEHVVGKWIDGRNVYEKTFLLSKPLSISTANWTESSISISQYNFREIMDCKAFVRVNGFMVTVYSVLASVNTAAFSNLAFISTRNVVSTDSIDVIILQYTKTTDTV